MQIFFCTKKLNAASSALSYQTSIWQTVAHVPWQKHRLFVGIRTTSTSDVLGYHIKIAGVIFCVPVYVTFMTSQTLSRIQENNYIGHRWLNNLSSENAIDHQWVLLFCQIKLWLLFCVLLSKVKERISVFQYMRAEQIRSSLFLLAFCRTKLKWMHEAKIN